MTRYLVIAPVVVLAAMATLVWLAYDLHLDGWKNAYN